METTTEPTKEIALILTGTLPVIIDNFPQCKEFYTKKMEDYKTVITVETVPTAKADLANLRAEIKRLETIRKEETKRLEAPITEMGAKVKELVLIIGTAVDHIEKQVKNFEDKTRAICLSLMMSWLNTHYETLQVREEYRTGSAQIPALVGISKLTGKGELTKAARESVEGLAQQGRMAQDRTDGRLNALKARCLEAGLETPLAPAYVEKWLQETDAVYESKISHMISEAVTAQKMAKEKRKAKAEKEAEELAEKARAKIREEEKVKADAEAKRQITEAAAKAEIELKHTPKPVDASPVSTIIVSPQTEKIIAPAPAPIQTPAEMVKSLTFPASFKFGTPAPSKIPLFVTVVFKIEANAGYDEGKIKSYFESQVKRTRLTGFMAVEVEQI